MELGDLKVLLFDDQRLKLKHYLSVLRFCGLREIHVAGALPEAMEIILANPLDLIIVTHFDEGVGLDTLLLELHGIEGSSGIPVLALAPDQGIRYSLRILSKGAAGVLVEPVSRETLERLVKQIQEPKEIQDPLSGLLRKAQELGKAGSLDQAVAAFNAYFTAYRSLYTTQNVRYFEGSLGLARVYAQWKRWLEAEEQLQTAIIIARSFPDKLETHRELPKAYWEYADLNERRGLLDKAIKSHRTALSVNPFFLPSITSLLTLLHRRERLDEMIQLLEETGDGFLPYSEPMEIIAGVLLDLANQSLETGRLGMAMALFDRLHRLPHGNVPVQLATADFLLAQGRISGVLTHLMALSVRVKHPALFFKIGALLLDGERWLHRQGRPKRTDRADYGFFVDREPRDVLAMARDAFREGLLLEPGDLGARLRLACCDVRLGERDLALQTLNELRGIPQKDASFHKEAIELLQEGHLWDEAERWLKTALRQWPRDVDLWQSYAGLLKGQHRSAEAAECLKRGLAVQPDHSGMNLALARHYQETQRPDAAIELLERAAELNRGDAEIERALRDLIASRQQPGKKSRWFGLAR